MKKIKVIVVDDSEVYRKVLRDALKGHPEIDVVSESHNGRLALPRIKFHRPDYIILDVNMPDMGGIETLENLKEMGSGAKVIMFSSASKESASITFESLRLGAIDFISKPNISNLEKLSSYIETHLIHKILSLEKSHRKSHEKVKVSQPTVKKAALTRTFEICAIGVSTGGPVALQKYFRHIKKDIKGAILVVQHMPEVFTKHFAESLDQQFPLIFHEARDGQKIEKGNVYIAPGGKHFLVTKKNNEYYCKITNDEPREFCRPSIDNLFESVAKEAPNKSIAIVMTGMGHDGTMGMQALKEVNGFTMVQSLDSCLIKSMPSNVMEKVHIDYSGDLVSLADKTNKLLGASF